MSDHSEATTSQPPLVKSLQESKSHHDSTQAEHKKVKDECEPLFIEDRTKDFQLHQPIRYESRKNASRLDEKQNASNQKQNNACWNCNSINHALNSCTEPRNQRKISQNRQIFLMQKQQQQQQGGRNFKNRYGGQKNNRYFFEGDLSIFGKFTPGQLSKELLQALNVPRNGIPLHVYYMREIGYPNGWLIDAREEYSGISIFTSPDECLPFPGREENEKNEIFHCNINKRKLHEYPGFNAPCPPDFIDNYKTLGCPIYNPEQSLELMYKRLKTNSIVKKSNENEIPGYSSITENVDIASNSKDTLIDEKVKPPSSPEDGEITDEDKDDICLNENGVESPCTDTNDVVLEKLSDDENHSDTFLSSVSYTTESVNGTQLSLSDPINANNESDLTPSSSKRKFGDIKCEVLGTPVLKRFSTYENRPSHDQFAKGMVDLVDHENLPNAVGTFKKMKEILKDVRETLKNLI